MVLRAWWETKERQSKDAVDEQHRCKVNTNLMQCDAHDVKMLILALQT